LNRVSAISQPLQPVSASALDCRRKGSVKNGGTPRKGLQLRDFPPVWRSKTADKAFAHRVDGVASAVLW
jgi:hypothetical protein